MAIPNPSRLKSWLFWRKWFTDKGEKNFNSISRKFEIDRIPSYQDWIVNVGNPCMFCHDSYIVEDPYGNTISCICATLDWQTQIQNKIDSYRSSVEPASLDTLDMEKKNRLTTDADQWTFVDAVNGARMFIQEPKEWLLFLGLPGTGKSHILRAINTAYDPIALYITASEVEDLTFKYRENENELSAFVDALKFAPILLFDDIGREYGGKFVKSIIDRVIDYRYSQPDLYTVATSNWRADELRRELMRSGDRLTDKAKTVVYGIRTESYRQVPLKDRQ